MTHVCTSLHVLLFNNHVLPAECRLKGNRQGQFSIRINDQYRICFVWSEKNAACDIEIVDYHS